MFNVTVGIILLFAFLRCEYKREDGGNPTWSIVWFMLAWWNIIVGVILF